MTLPEIIARNPHPLTLPQMINQLRALGLTNGMTLLCHSSLSSLGWVNGGAQTVILALEETIGKRGTLVMPTQTWGFSNPALWTDPPVPDSWWKAICTTMPPFDADLSPCTEMGIIPDTFRKQKGSRRSNHPQHSFAARGPKSRRIIHKHSLDFGLGDQSPLGTLYELDASILLLGCGWTSCTALHLAEHRAHWSWKAESSEYAPVKGRGWTKMRNWNISSDDFEQCGRDFEQNSQKWVVKGRIGNADSRLIRLKPLVDFALNWFGHNRASQAT